MAKHGKLGFIGTEEILRRLCAGEDGFGNVNRILKKMKFQQDTRGMTVQECLQQLLKLIAAKKKEFDKLDAFSTEQLVGLWALFNSSFPLRTINYIFGHADEEWKIKKPVEDYFKTQGFDVFSEIPIGRSRADLVLRKQNVFGTSLVAIELKTHSNEMKRALDQLTDYSKVVDRVYLATTSVCILKYQEGSGEKITDIRLLEKLESIGSGLILVDLSSSGKECSIQLESRNRFLDSRRKTEFVNSLKNESSATK